MATSLLTEMNLEIKQCRRRKDDITVVSSVIKLSQSVTQSALRLASLSLFLVACFSWSIIQISSERSLDKKMNNNYILVHCFYILIILEDVL